MPPPTVSRPTTEPIAVADDPSLQVQGEAPRFTASSLVETARREHAADRGPFALPSLKTRDPTTATVESRTPTQQHVDTSPAGAISGEQPTEGSRAAIDAEVKAIADAGAALNRADGDVFRAAIHADAKAFHAATDAVHTAGDAVLHAEAKLFRSVGYAVADAVVDGFHAATDVVAKMAKIWRAGIDSLVNAGHK